MTKYCTLSCYHESVREKAREKILDKFGLTRDQWMQMRADCDDLCQICGKPETVTNNAKTNTINLTIDHDHKTGAVRGLLCVRCNFGLSHIDASEEWLERASSYLKRSRKLSLRSPEGIQRALRIMREYLDLRLEMNDYHGIMDAAADIRELEAQLRLLKAD